MGAVAPLSVLLVGMIGIAVVLVAVVRIAWLERKVLVPRRAPLVSVTADVEPLVVPGAAAA